MAMLRKEFCVEEEEIFICDLKIINSLEEAVEKFRDL